MKVRKSISIAGIIFVAVAAGLVILRSSAGLDQAITLNISHRQPAVKSQITAPKTQPGGPAGFGGQHTSGEDSVGRAIHRGVIPIIMYHYIRVSALDDPNGVSLSVTPEHFSQQLDNLRQRGYQTVTFQDLALGRMPAKPIILTFDDGYEDFYQEAFPELQHQHMKAVVYVVANFHQPEYLTPEQVKKLSKAGMEIGSHTLDHWPLVKATPTELTQQLNDSKYQLEALIGQPVVSIAYPFGSYNKIVENGAVQARYDYAVTTIGGMGDLAQPMVLKRFRAKDKPVLEFDEPAAQKRK